jgi:hypothetical protein
MNLQRVKMRVLIVGSGFPTFQVDWRCYAQTTDMEVVGFISFADESDVSFHPVKGCLRSPIPIYPVGRIEEAIDKLRVHKCCIRAQNILMRDLAGVIHRIISTGGCMVEFMH